MVAAQHACLVVFRHSVGDFVPVGAAILEVHGAAWPALAGEHHQLRARLLDQGRDGLLMRAPRIGIRPDLRVVEGVAVRLDHRAQIGVVRHDACDIGLQLSECDPSQQVDEAVSGP